MAIYTVRIEADATSCPVLLSNGNLVESGKVSETRHYTVWNDPYPKPSYLFAIVAGNLVRTASEFTTMSGKKVDLHIYTAAKDQNKTQWAMESLKRAMKWDEDKFGLEYDLNLFNIVAVDDFNMGAMENKSLNIFNSKLILTSPTTSVDSDFESVEGVVGHEYFHNYTGNRVTCRDWFQLTLKEGLTVYRDHEFSSDMNGKDVQRIQNVIRLRASQFPEDSGPMSHPVRPDSYLKMDNFYTATVYEKGSEVVRMYATVLGEDGFRKGMDKYLGDNDGKAVTCDDFWQAMVDANKDHPAAKDMPALLDWYAQAGTPTLTVTRSYNEADRTLTITLKQTHKPTPGQPTKKPVLIPVRTGLVGADGQPLPVILRDTEYAHLDNQHNAILRLVKEEQSFTFEQVPPDTVPSVLRGFSAPVYLVNEGQTDEELAFLLKYDSDFVNRWDAGQAYARKVVLSVYDSARQSVQAALGDKITAEAYQSLNLNAFVEQALREQDQLVQAYTDALRSVFTDKELAGGFIASTATLPPYAQSFEELAQKYRGAGGVDPVLLFSVNQKIAEAVGAGLTPELEQIVSQTDQALQGLNYEPSPEQIGNRALRNSSLAYLSRKKTEDRIANLHQRYHAATNFTDETAMLRAISHFDTNSERRQEAFDRFFEKFQNEPLALLVWIREQVSTHDENSVQSIRRLLEHPKINLMNPNTCYNLFLGFARGGIPAFHNINGEGYKFLADSIEMMDKKNPHVASAMTGPFTLYKSLDPIRQKLVEEQLQRLNKASLSENVSELLVRTLNM